MDAQSGPAASGPAEGLAARSLRKSFRGRRVLDGIDVVVRPGEVVGLLGPNGAGKTTTFRILAGVESSDDGTVLLDGDVLDGLPLWRRVRRGLGWLPQEPSVFRRLTVRENVKVALEVRGAPDSLADRLIEEAGLSALAAAPAGTLSGGERRRLEIARCLAAAPRVLLLDEPFTGVDPVAVSDLQKRIVGLAERGLGVLVTDHAVREALRICDRAVILDLGRVIAAGTPDEVASDAGVRARYLGDEFRLDVPARTS